jgi:UTP--glucose-1-phosphate uridylyltransferase
MEPTMTRYPEMERFSSQIEAAGLHPLVVESFGRLYGRYRDGDPGTLPWAGVSPAGPDEIVEYDSIDAEDRARGERLLSELAVISLNGGLGTTMKLAGAKSLIPVHDGESFLDLTARQVLGLRATSGHRVPWLLMNSFRTRDDTLKALCRFPDLAVEGLPLDFLQNRVPRVVQETHLPLELEPEDVNWAPPGHGDVYLALHLNGLLEAMLERGIRWAFVSNVDNLGGTVDPAILGFMERSGVEFIMELTDRTIADIKGGPMVRFTDPRVPGSPSRLMLLERSQVEEERLAEFEDLSVFPVFNTNSLWWRVDAMLEQVRQGPLDLPMIVNPKTVQGVEVVQLETAMGAAVGCFERSLGVKVPRSRFAPVKATSDLLVVRSDAYVVDPADLGLRPNPSRQLPEPPVVQLDARYFKGLPDFDARVPCPPSLLRCRSLTVEGDVRFGENVRVEGDVTIRNPTGEQRSVPHGAALVDETLEL